MELMVSRALLVWVTIVFLIACGPAQSVNQMARPAPQVDVVTLVEEDLLFQQTLPARSVASREAEVRPQVSGIIIKRNFEEGSLVEAGQTLYQIDDAIYQANLLAAKAALAITQSNFHEAKAELKRYKVLIKENAVSQQALEKIEAQHNAYQAELRQRESVVHKEKVFINYTKILAPISGRISKSYITEGALVTAQQSQALATITQLDPIYFDLAQTNTQLRTLQQRLASGELNKVEENAELIFGDGQIYPHKGLLKFNEVQTSVSTDTVTMRVEFSNPDMLLLPGMYTRVKLVQAQRKNSILVPQKAVQFDHQGKAFVFVLDAEQHVAQRTIEIDRDFHGNWLVTEGLNKGEQVVTTGLQKIAPGILVSPVSSLAAADTSDSTEH